MRPVLALAVPRPRAAPSRQGPRWSRKARSPGECVEQPGTRQGAQEARAQTGPFLPRPWVRAGAGAGTEEGALDCLPGVGRSLSRVRLFLQSFKKELLNCHPPHTGHAGNEAKNRRCKSPSPQRADLLWRERQRLTAQWAAGQEKGQWVRGKPGGRWDGGGGRGWFFEHWSASGSCL